MFINHKSVDHLISSTASTGGHPTRCFHRGAPTTAGAAEALVELHAAAAGGMGPGHVATDLVPVQVLRQRMVT